MTDIFLFNRRHLLLIVFIFLAYFRPVRRTYTLLLALTYQLSTHICICIQRSLNFPLPLLLLLLYALMNKMRFDELKIGDLVACKMNKKPFEVTVSFTFPSVFITNFD